MAEELKQAAGLLAEVRPGNKGQFDILSEGKVVFSKAATQRFPDPGEVAELLARAGRA